MVTTQGDSETTPMPQSSSSRPVLPRGIYAVWIMSIVFNSKPDAKSKLIFYELRNLQSSFIISTQQERIKTRLLFLVEGFIFSFSHSAKEDIEKVFLNVFLPLPKRDFQLIIFLHLYSQTGLLTLYPPHNFIGDFSNAKKKMIVKSIKAFGGI